ncbi:MAG: thioesterase family protein [Rikenellaceae bacterium]
MITHTTEIRVRYGEVDQMQFLYHSHYVEYFDIARTELIRSLGITNRELEEQGVMLPVLNVNIDYGTPANYDDLLTIRTTLREKPKVKITFHYEVFRGEELLTTGSVTLAFMNSETKRAIRPPKHLLAIIEPYFKEEK